MGAVTGEATHISCRNAKLSGMVNLPQTKTTNLSFGVLHSTSSGVLLGSSTQLKVKEFDADYNYTIETCVLEPQTTYYYRSYIIQNEEVEYGETKSFKTLAVSSMIQTLDASGVNPKDATLNATSIQDSETDLSSAASANLSQLGILLRVIATAVAACTMLVTTATIGLPLLTAPTRTTCASATMASSIRLTATIARPVNLSAVSKNNSKSACSGNPCVARLSDHAFCGLLFAPGARPKSSHRVFAVARFFINENGLFVS